MNRRDFLLVKTEGRETVMELSCEKLYMQFADSRGAPAEIREAGRLLGADSWSGEPDAQLSRSNLNEFFRHLERQLESADVLRMQNPDWLQDQDFKARVYEMLSEYEARGGRVQICKGDSV